MSGVIDKLACKMGRNDEIPNIEVAEYLYRNNDIDGIKEIIDGFKGTDKPVANDCIKVLYEIGKRNPKLICDYTNEFITCLRSKNNRLAWGSMTALATIAEYSAQPIFEKLPSIILAYQEGSVITVDNSITVFAKLCKAGDFYAETVFPIIMNHLQKCRPKEVPQHAERASICINSKNVSEFLNVLEKRKPDLTSSQRTRINKLMKKLHILYEIQQ